MSKNEYEYYVLDDTLDSRLTDYGAIVGKGHTIEGAIQDAIEVADELNDVLDRKMLVCKLVKVGKIGLNIIEKTIVTFTTNT